MDIRENELIMFHDKSTVRVIYENQFSSIIYVIDMNKVRWPFSISKSDPQLQEDCISLLIEDTYIRPVNEDTLSNAEIERRESAWNIVQFIFQQVSSEQLIFNGKYRNQAILEAMNVYKVSYNTVKNYLIEYWKGGKTKNGLLPNYHLCGAAGKEKKIGEKKRGRPKQSNSSGVNVNDKIKKYFRIGLNRYYYNGRQNTLKTTYELTIRDFFTEVKGDKHGNEVRTIEDPSMIPTYQQFLYWYKKFNDPKKELINRNGIRNYYQNHRAIIGDSTQDAGLGPGTLWQIDSTQFDIYLVSTVNRNLIVGRPTLICVIDVFSRMIVGINVTFETFNSYTGVMVALANSMTPKEDFCLQYGITLDEGEWDVACIPQRIFADRGELNGKMIEDAISALGISIQNSPPYRADYKGIIEQAFAQLNLKVKPFADGIVKNGKHQIERGEEDYRLKANLTIEEFTRIIIKCVLFHNNHHVLSQYVLDEMMLEEGVEKIPSKIWKHGLKERKGQLRILPEKTIKSHLLPSDTASITARGVKYKKMLYAPDYSLKNHWYQQARINGSTKIKIWYDPRNLSSVFTINEEGDFHELTLLDHLSKFKDKGMDEITTMIKYEEKIDDKSKENELQAKMKLFEDIDEIVGKGRKSTSAQRDDSISRTQRVKGIRENQKMERELLREKLIVASNEQSIEEQEYPLREIDTEEDELGIFRLIQDIEWDDDNE